jgi:hypothetical protein
MQSQNVRYRVAIAAACAAFTFVYVITSTSFRNSFLIDPDTFLHISVGKWIVENGGFPVVDSFSYTASGKTWFATDWISELALAVLYKVGHWRAVTEIVAVTSAVISGVLCFYLAMRLRFSIAFGLAIIIVTLISPHFLARPVIFSYMILTIWIILILDMDDHDEWTQWRGFILIPIMLLWANVHGSFTFGLAVFYLFLGNAIWDVCKKKDLRRLRLLIVLLGGVTIAAIITPYGPFATLKTVKLMSDPALAIIDEWRAPDFQHDPFHLFAIVGLFAPVLYFGIRLRGARLLTLLLVTVFALEHKRGLGLFALVAPLLLIRPLSDCVPWMRVQVEVLDPVIQFLSKRSSTIVVACTLIVAITGIVMWTVGPRIQPPIERTPENAIAAAKRAGIKGNVLNSHAFGGYLIFEGVPTFVDGRVELYGNEFLRRYFDALKLVDPDDAVQLLKQYNIRWALLRPHEPIVFMLKSNGWVQLYSDQSAIVLANNR